MNWRLGVLFAIVFLVVVVGFRAMSKRGRGGR